MVFRKIKHITFGKGAKIAFITIFSVLAVLYLAFLFVIPNVININSFIPQIQEILSEYTTLKPEIINPKISTTWDLGVKLNSDKISLNYTDDTPFFSIENASVKINLPTLLIKHLNLDKIYIKRGDINLVFDKNKKYTIFNHIIEQKKEAITGDEENPQDEDIKIELPIEIRNINIVIDEANIRLKDENISKTFLLKGENNQLKMKSLNGPITFKTKGYLITEGESGKKFLDFDINLESVFPENTSETTQNDEASFEIPNYNPLVNLEKFNFYTNLYTNLKITDLSDKFKARGEVKIDKITALIKTIQLPESSLNMTFKNDEINTDVNLYIADNESIRADAKINTSKNFDMNIGAKTEKISIDNLRILSGAILDILNIENDFKNMSAGGYLTCDFKLSGNSKKLQSTGTSELKGGYLKYNKANLNLTNIVSLLDFSDNKLTIKDTSAILNGSKFSIRGNILANSDINIDVISDPIKIPDIMKLGTQLKLIREKDFADYDFKGGILTLGVKLKGKLDNIIPDAEVKIDNLLMTIKSLQMPVSISNIMVKAKPDGKDFIADTTVNTLHASLPFPKLSIDSKEAKLKINSSQITLNKTPFTVDGAKSEIDGEIINYGTKPEFKFDLKGILSPVTFINSTPKENRNLIKSSGNMPYNALVSGDFNNIKVKGEMKTDSKNYVSIIDIDSVKGLENTLDFDLVLSGQNLLLNDISIDSKGSKIASVKGNLSSIYAKNPVIKTLQISIPKELKMTISALGNLKTGILANLNITGSVQNPNISGNANLSSLVYPEYKLTASNIRADFKKSAIDVLLQGINISKSDLDLEMQVSNNFSKAITINNITLNSGKLDTDELLNMASKMPNTQTTPGPSAPSLIINTGHASIKKATSGNLSAENISFDFNLKNNLFSLNKLSASAYSGLITGDISYQIEQLRAKANVAIKNLNVGQFSRAMAGVIIPISGTLTGDADVTFKGADLNSQLKTLSGKTNFVVEKGEAKEFIKLENFLHAGNILTQNIFGFNLNSVLSTISSKNTGEFKRLDSIINFSNSWATVEKFKMQGYNMSLDVKGKYNILTNYADLKVLGRISSSVANAMGPLSKYSLGQTVDNLADQNEVVSKIVKIAKTVAPTNSLLDSVTKEEISKIPPLVDSSIETKEFAATIQGVSTKTTSVKMFKWLKAE